MGRLLLLLGSFLFPSSSLGAGMQPMQRGGPFPSGGLSFLQERGDPPAAITREEATAFVRQYAPDGASDVSAEYLAENTEFALKAREELGYATELPRDLFMSYVLPFASFDEPRDNWRPKFYRMLKPYVKDATSLNEAANAVWRPIWSGALGKELSFQGNMTPQIMAPVSETLKKGYASCTGMSILLCNALRSVSIPARIVGTNEWNRPEGGNHNWVEVWTGESWNFVDAVPTTEPLVWNQTWFIKDASKAVPGKQKGILSPLWGPSANTGYELSWREGAARRELPAIDVTAEYTTPLQPPLSALPGSPPVALGILAIGGVGVAVASYCAWQKFGPGAGYEKLETD